MSVKGILSIGTIPIMVVNKSAINPHIRPFLIPYEIPHDFDFPSLSIQNLRALLILVTSVINTITKIVSNLLSAMETISPPGIENFSISPGTNITSILEINVSIIYLLLIK
uniref:Uncharacterized protein n=1 Tax=viral metagenome TaxID=1070528 RepID=A0A6C0J7W2_9ZZZZ